MLRRFCQPRRLFLSSIACLLAVVWLGNAALTIWLREAAAPETLRALLSLGLVLYATWHFAKAAFFRPESPFEWTPAEHDLLSAMPLLPGDLVAYQLASVTVTTLLKACLFALLLLPDLRCVPLALMGLVVALFALEMLRMTVDITAWGLGRRAFLAYRAFVVAALVAGGFAVGAALIRENAFARINVGEGLLERLLDVLIQLYAAVFRHLALPFRPLIELIVADGITAARLGFAAAAVAVVATLAVAVIGLYQATAARVVRRERRNYELVSATRELSAMPSVALRRPSRRAPRRIPRCGGAGPLLWRQLIGARSHWGALLTAMIAPAVLACAPCFVIADPYIAFLSTTGTLAFYTFLLLPTALRFDFRRDLDRLAILKGLPITPAAVAIGQTFAPVLIATLFQSAVLALAVSARSLPPEQLVVAMLVMLPLNVLVFALDNLIFLLYPYRVQQEGLEIFLRTMLTFTGKGLLFAAGLAAMAAWGFAAAALTRAIAAWIGHTIDAHAVFAAGMIAGPSLAATLVLYGLACTYRNMDPIEDVPR
ncbi:MAG: hypothetical protein WD669_05145 [Pirellulales bacterium]